MSDPTHDTTEQVFTFICDYITAHGMAPSQREIASGCFISKGTVTRHLYRLVTANRIKMIPDIQRGIRLAED